MYYSTAKEMEKLDKLAVARGLSICQMMELAGFHMIELFKILKIKKTAKVVVFCGKGNKGGDGLSATRHLINNGFKNITIVLLSLDIKRDSKNHLNLLKKMNVPIILFGRETKKVETLTKKTDVIIDALIGYQLRGVSRGVFAKAIMTINGARKKVIAYDLPSGVDVTSGKCLSPCVRAFSTLTLALPKKLFQTKEGKRMSGKVYVADIGIPSFLYNKISKNSRPNFGKFGLLKLLS